MPKTTANYKLTKPFEEEFYDVNVFNANADTIDEVLGNFDARITNNSTTGQQNRVSIGSLAQLQTNNKTSVVMAINEVKNGITGIGADVARLKGKIGNYKVIAASNSSAGVKSGADYVCTGASDNTIINAAISELGEQGGLLIFAAGLYRADNSIFIDNDNVTLVGVGDAEIEIKTNGISITGQNAVINGLSITAGLNCTSLFSLTTGNGGKSADNTTIVGCRLSLESSDIISNTIVNNIGFLRFINNNIYAGGGVDNECKFFKEGAMQKQNMSVIATGNFANKSIVVNADSTAAMFSGNINLSM